jgi:catalase
MSMLFLTRWFGVTGSDAERDLVTEKSVIDQIVEKVLLLQSNSAAQQHRPIGRGTHVKGTSAVAKFEVFDVTSGRDSVLAQRLAKGIFAKPGVYPATVRFGNADPKVNSDFKADVRSLSFSVDLTREGTVVPVANVSRQDFSLQNTSTLPINDARAFLATMQLLTASNPAAGLWALQFKDKLRVLRTLSIVQVQAHQKIQPYQKLRYGSNVPFRHGPIDIVKYSATPLPDNAAHPLQKGNSNALQDELIRHLKEDGKMSSFDFGIQFLDANRMTYWGKRQDVSFWTENASIKWKESQAPFHTVGRLTLQANSQLLLDAADAVYFDVTRNSSPDSLPVGSINRARWQGEAASKKARMSVIAEGGKAMGSSS